MSKLSFSFFPNIAKRTAKTNDTPVYVRVMLRGKKAESRLNLELNEREVKCWNPRLMRVDLPKSIANDHLDSISTEFKKFLAVNDHLINSLSVNQIRDMVLNKDQPNKNMSRIIDYVNQYNLKSISSRNSLSSGTKKNYAKAIKHFTNFLTYEKLYNLSFKDFEYKHSESFKNYLLNDNAVLKKKGMAEVSALGMIKKFRTIFDHAVEENLIEKNYFKKIKLSNQSPRKPRFTIDQLKSIYYLDKNLSKQEELCKDLIVFSSLTGLAFLDTVKLAKITLENRTNGEVKLDTTRTKTGKPVEQFLTSFALNIISKYKDHPLVIDSKYVFPNIDNSTYNKTLKVLAYKAGVNFNVSTHTGRHSFRQLLPEAEVEDSSVISRMMGKVGDDKIDNIYYEITESRLIDAKRKFELYLSNNLNGEKEST